MAITSDGTQSFGIQDSPVTINSISYICESMSFTYGSNVPEIADGNGEAIGRTVVPTPVEFSATIQYSTDSAVTAPNPELGQELVTSTTNGRNNATYVITEVGDAQSQGDYAKCSISGYKKLN